MASKPVPLKMVSFQGFKMRKELIEKAKKAENKEELKKLAKEEKITLTDEQAEKVFEELHVNGELSDDELDNVTGGCGGSSYKSSDKPKFHVGDRVTYDKKTLFEGLDGYIPGITSVTSVVQSYDKPGDVFIYQLVNGDKIRENELRFA